MGTFLRPKRAKRILIVIVVVGYANATPSKDADNAAVA
jgi:hypothetical protein